MSNSLPALLHSAQAQPRNRRGVPAHPLLQPQRRGRHRRVGRPAEAEPRRAAQLLQPRLRGRGLPGQPARRRDPGPALLPRHRRRARPGGVGGADGAGRGLPRRAGRPAAGAASRRPSSSPAASVRWAQRAGAGAGAAAHRRGARHAADRPQLRRHAGRAHRPQHHLPPHHAQARPHRLRQPVGRDLRRHPGVDGRQGHRLQPLRHPGQCRRRQRDRPAPRPGRGPQHEGDRGLRRGDPRRPALHRCGAGASRRTSRSW